MDKGITLIALIITIIVLLILAVVALRAVQGDGIILHARKASSEHDRGQKEEEKQLSKTQYELARAEFEQAKAKGLTTARTPDEYILEKTYGVKIKIGDYVTYNPGSHTHKPDISKGAGTGEVGGNGSTGYTLSTSTVSTQTNLSWRVLGANSKGELQLISSDPTSQRLYLANDKGYVYAEENLNNFCNDLYGKGTYATGARSLNADDINKLTNYNPNTYKGYGEKWIYRYPTTTQVSGTRYMQYSKDGGKTWTDITYSKYQTFRLPGETTLINSDNPGSKELEYTYYCYSISSNLTPDDGFTADEATAISNMICKGTTSSNIIQYLASRYVSVMGDKANFGVRIIDQYGYVSNGNLHDSNEFYTFKVYPVRPVVSLKSDISLSSSGKNMWNIEAN